MKDLIGLIFNVLATMFDKIPFLNKFKGYRSVIGFIGLAVVGILSQINVGDPEILKWLQIGFTGFTALSLNAKKTDV